MGKHQVIWIAVITLATIKLAYLASPTQAMASFGVNV